MKIHNGIPRRQKIYFIRPKRYHIFGTDFERRDNMTDDEAVRCFDDVWEREIKNGILNGDVVAPEEALGLLSEQSKHYLNKHHEHRKFKLAEAVFVAQLNASTDGVRIHNQLWPVPARNYDTRTLYVTFPTQDERDAWNDLAEQLGYEPEELGLRALRGFLLAFTAKPAGDSG